MFGIDADSYARSIYAPQEETSAKMTGSIAVKLNDLLYDTDDVNNFEKAIKRLDERRAFYKKKRGDKDEISNTVREIEDLDGKIQNCEDCIAETQRLRTENLTLGGEIADVEKKIAAVDEKIKAAHKISGYNALKNGYNKLRQEIQARENLFGGNIPSEEEINERYKDLQKLESIQYRIRETDLDQNEKAEYAALKEQFAQSPKEGKKSVPFYLYAPGAAAAVMLIAGILLISSSLPAALAILAVSLICAVAVAGLLLKNYFSQKINAQTEMLGKQRYNILTQKVNQIEARRSELSSEAERITRKINGFLSVFNLQNGETPTAEKLDGIKKRLSEYKWLKQQEAAERQKIEDYIRENNITKEHINSQQDEQTLNNIKSRYQFELNDRKERLIRNTERIEALSKEAEKLTSYRERKQGRQEYLSRCKFNCAMLDKATEFLEKAKENLSARYLSKMQQSFVKYASFMAGEGIGKAALSSDLDVCLEYNGENKQSEYFSKGYRSIFQICARLALIESLFGNEKPFIILDDPFVNLDDGKVGNALKILKDLSQNIQIIYLVCHSSRIIGG